MVLGVKNKDSDQGSLKYGLEQNLQDRTASRISFIFSVENYIVMREGSNTIANANGQD
jgi:hypothetical protein